MIVSILYKKVIKYKLISKRIILDQFYFFYKNRKNTFFTLNILLQPIPPFFKNYSQC